MVTLSGITLTGVLVTPYFILGNDGTTTRVYDKLGNFLGGLLLGITWRAQVCTGANFLVIGSGGSDDFVYHVYPGQQQMRMRRYDSSAWKPYCHSLAVASDGGLT